MTANWIARAAALLALAIGLAAMRPAAYASRHGLRAAAGTPAVPRTASLELAQLAAPLDAARARWGAASLSADERQRLDRIAVEIADLDGAMLGDARGASIRVDRNAAGWGWFVDPTPDDDSEFADGEADGIAARIDLLTVLIHEIGHVLGRTDADAGAATDEVMQSTLPLATRRTPAVRPSPATGSATISPTIAIPAGRSVTLTLDATVVKPFPVGVTSVSTQATVSADGLTSVMSDDPATQPSRRSPAPP